MTTFDRNMGENTRYFIKNDLIQDCTTVPKLHGGFVPSPDQQSKDR